jgi:outer membrane receptor protein involved in Fe transport
MKTEIIASTPGPARPRAALALLAVFWGIAAPAAAQTSLGDIRGTVVAQLGGPLAGATVVVTSTDSRVVRQTRTDARGLFSVPGLPPGSYEVTASLEGFASQRQEGLRLGPGDAILSNLELRKAVMPETLALASLPSAMEPLRTHPGTAVSPDEIAHLPLGSRDVLALALLAPAVTRDGASDVSVAGLPASMNRVVVDGTEIPLGTSTAEPGEWARSPHRLPREMVESQQVASGGAAAQAGGAAGAVIAVATPAGSRRASGTVFERYRAPRLRAATVEPGLTAGSPASSAHQFGAGIGGPLAGDRHFFFASYDGLRERDENRVAVTLPAGLPDDGLTRAGIGRLSAGEWRRSMDQNLFAARTDHRVSGAHQASVSYRQRTYAGINTEWAGPRVAESATGPSSFAGRAIAATIGSTLRSDLFNDVRILYARAEATGGTLQNGAPQADVYALGSLALRTGGSMYGARDTRLHRVEVGDTLTWPRGSHLFDAGVEAQIDRVDDLFASGLNGSYVFRTPASFGAGALIAPGDSYTQSFLPPGRRALTTRPHGETYAVFVQDAWQATGALVVDAGVRYAVHRYARADGLTLPLGTAAAASRVRTDADNWEPRVGVAWTPSPRYVVRASYGIRHGRVPAALVSAAQAYNGSLVRTITLGPNDAGGPEFPNRLPEAPAAAKPSLVAVDAAFSSPRVRYLGVGLEWEWMRSTSLSATYTSARGDNLPLAIEGNVGPALIVPMTVADTGAVVPTARVTAGPFAEFDRVVRLQSTGESAYDGLTVELRRRLTAGLDFRLGYTAARAAGTAPLVTSVALGSLADRAIARPGSAGRVASDHDQRHRFVSSAVLFTDDFAGRFDGPLETVLDDWRLGALYTLEGGRPFTAYVDMDLDGDGNRYNDVAPGTERNAFRRPKEGRLDVRAAREIALPRGLRLLATVDVFNLLNATHYREVEATLYTVAGDTLVPNPQFGKRFDAKPPRVMQLGVALRF